MLLSHFKRLCTLWPSLISALAQNTDRSSPAPTSLPASIQRAVPACAQPCLLAALLDRYPLACTSPPNIACLCSRYSSSGETLGEVALTCIYAACPLVEEQAQAAYNICGGQDDIARPTQTALTVTAKSSTRSQAMAPTSSLVQSTPTSTSRSLSSIPSTADESIVADALSTSSPSTSSQPTTTATTAAATSPPSMKPAQIAGLSVAAAAAFIIAIGLMVLSAYLRKRREENDLAEADEEEKRGFPPGFSYQRFSGGSQPTASPREAPKQFPSAPLPVHTDNPPPWSPPPAHVIYDRAATPDLPEPYPRRQEAKKAPRRPKRPGSVRPRESTSSAVPLEQIGLAISAGETATSTAKRNASPRPPPKPEAKQQRPSSLRLNPPDTEQRPISTATQGTVFEEDVSPTRRRSSRLLPTPPIPIPPIRALQPSRPPATLNPPARPPRSEANRSQGTRQLGLSLDIPIRHSRSLENAPQRPAELPKPAAPVSYPIHLSVPSEHLSRSTSATSTDIDNSGDIPDYYFTTDGSSPESAGPVQGRRQAQSSPRLVTIKAKKSSSTVASRALSKASTNVRDSISSQTSFESVGSNDPTPEEEEEKQLSPVAESPISLLRYPKVPRASNQLVPRSPRSARSSHSLQSQGSPRTALAPSALLIKRLGEQEALRLEDRLRMDKSPPRRGGESHGKKYGHHRSISMETGTSSIVGPSSGPQPRAHSGQWVQSPAMYDVDMVAPLRIQSRQPPPRQSPHRQQYYYHHQQYQAGWQPEPQPQPKQTPQMEALKSPGWVPNITPTRQGDDLFLSVTYSKPIG